MSTRAEVRDWLGELKPGDSPRTCAVCDTADWSVMWAGAIALHICRRCALEVLPQLIADALWFPGLRSSEGDRICDAVRAEFWRAIAIQALKRCESA
jgi:hypothetical protein